MSNTCETEIIEEIIEEYDDKGVLCRYTEEDGWVPIEDCCEKCGCRPDDCECGLCCICEDDEATEFHRGDGYCESCAIDNWKLIMQDMADEEDRINAEEDEEEEEESVSSFNLRACDCCGESEKNGKEYTYDDLVEQEDGNTWWCKECVKKN